MGNSNLPHAHSMSNVCGRPAAKPAPYVLLLDRVEMEDNEVALKWCKKR